MVTTGHGLPGSSQRDRELGVRSPGPFEDQRVREVVDEHDVDVTIPIADP